MFVVGQHSPVQRGREPSISPNFWDLLHASTQYEKQQPNIARWSN